METTLFKIVQIKNIFQKSILYIKKRIKKNIPKNNNNN